MDALVHAIEAYIARVATPVARGLALEAARRIGRALERVCIDGSDKEARDEMAIGSHLAGWLSQILRAVPFMHWLFHSVDVLPFHMEPSPDALSAR